MLLLPLPWAAQRVADAAAAVPRATWSMRPWLPSPLGMLPKGRRRCTSGGGEKRRCRCRCRCSRGFSRGARLRRPLLLRRLLLIPRSLHQQRTVMPAAATAMACCCRPRPQRHCRRREGRFAAPQKRPRPHDRMRQPLRTTSFEARGPRRDEHEHEHEHEHPESESDMACVRVVRLT
jgi:hypothetical protein